MSGITLDAAGMIALDRNDRRVIALIARAEQLRQRITIPATALAQAMRAPAKQARLSRLVRQASTKVVALDRAESTRIGIILAATRTSDIADAHVVLCARREGDAIVTSNPGDLRRLDPGVRLVII
jgi:hypothetical protein